MPQLIHTTKWTFDYIIFRKKTQFFLKKVSIEYKRCSSAAHVPYRAYNGAAGYDDWSAEEKVLKQGGREWGFFI